MSSIHNLHFQAPSLTVQEIVPQKAFIIIYDILKNLRHCANTMIVIIHTLCTRFKGVFIETEDTSRSPTPYLPPPQAAPHSIPESLSILRRSFWAGARDCRSLLEIALCLKYFESNLVPSNSNLSIVQFKCSGILQRTFPLTAGKDIAKF